MAAVKSKDTKPEMLVRKYLFSKGLRYRLHAKDLPGKPDMVFPKYKTVVFIDGCFWHGHKNCDIYRFPKSNVEFWRQKINMNIARDYRSNVELDLLGWKVIRVWECALKKKALRDQTLYSLYYHITSNQEPIDTPIAAETPAPYGK